MQRLDIEVLLAEILQIVKLLQCKFNSYLYQQQMTVLCHEYYFLSVNKLGSLTNLVRTNRTHQNDWYIELFYNVCCGIRVMHCFLYHFVLLFRAVLLRCYCLIYIKLCDRGVQNKIQVNTCTNVFILLEQKLEQRNQRQCKIYNLL